MPGLTVPSRGGGVGGENGKTGARGLQNEVEEVAGEDDEEGDGAKEDAAKPPGHDVAQHGGFR